MRKIAALVFMFCTALTTQIAAQTCATTGSGCRGSITASGANCSTAGACVSTGLLNNIGALVITASGTFVATVALEGSGDGGLHWTSLNAVPIPIASQATSFTAPGFWQVAVAGLTNVRARCSAFTSGTAVVQFNTSPGMIFVPALTGNQGGTVIISGGAVADGSAAVPNSLAGPGGGNALLATTINTPVSTTTTDRVAACTKSAVVNVAAAATTVIIPLAAGTTTRVCGVYLVANGTTNVTFQNGTGATCGTGTNTLSGPLGLITGTPFNANAGWGYMFKASAAANDVCLVNSAAIQVSGWISYAQY